MFFQDVISLIDKSITMKTIITFTFLLFSFLGFSQTTREEVVERNKSGHKIEVNTYTGTGNGERLIKKTRYYDGERHVSVQPIQISYYGKYKREDYYSGKTTTYLCWGMIKEETFDENGVLKDTWKLSDVKPSESVKLTILP
jgi:hypothetical protein